MLDEARRLLQAAEAEADPERKLAALEEALDLLEEVENTTLAGNLRRSYTRRLIVQLVQLRKVDVLTWFDYARVLLVRLQPEVASALQEDPELKRRHEEFLALWPVDAARALKGDSP